MNTNLCKQHCNKVSFGSISGGIRTDQKVKIVAADMWGDGRTLYEGEYGGIRYSTNPQYELDYRRYYGLSAEGDTLVIRLYYGGEKD
jgi:hypothetical protein